MSAAPVVLGITIRADGSAQVAGEINRVQTAVTGTGTAVQNTNREFARMAAAMDSAVQAAAAVNARLASATAIYDNQVARLTMTTQAYRAYQLQLDGLHPSQIRHIQDLEAAQAAATRTSTSMSGLSSVLSAFGLTLGLVGLAGLAKDILDTNRSMESLRAQLLALTGSAEQAQQTFDFITKFAVNTPFEIQGLTKAFITLQNYGLTPTTEVMQAITDQSAKLGGRTETLQGITLALGQAWGKGKLQGQEILQMVDQGVPVWDLLAKVTGKNVAELQKMSENGEITRDVIDKLIKKMGELATGSNAAAMDTLNGKISNLADAWHQFEDALLQSKAEGVIKDIVNSITNTLNILTNQLGSTIDNQISHAKARIDTFNSMGAVGGFISDMSGYDINAEKNKLDSLNRIKQTQDEAAAIKTKTDEIKKANDMQVVSSDTTKKGAAELAKLADTNSKLTLSNHDYVKQQLIAQGVEGEALVKAMSLSDANDKLTASHKTLSKETNSSAKEAAALAKSFDAAIEAANLHNVSLAKTPRELEEATLKSKGYTDAMVKQAMALYDIGTALEATKKLHETEKTELQALTDQYNKLTMSAHDYYASTLTSKKIPEAEQAPLMAQFNKNSGAEAAKKATDAAKSSLDAYNKSLDSANVKTSDLGAVSSVVFDGALGGINIMAGAFDKMVNSITANSKALDENAKMQALNNSSADSAEKAANTKRYAEEEINLNEKITNDKLTGVRQMAGAVSSMLTKGSDAQKAAHAIEVGIAAWQMTQQAVKMVSYIKEGAVWLQLNATKLAGEITEGATHAAMALGFVAEEEVKGTAAAATAVAVASQSSPWTGFITGAAMLAAMAAIGFSLMGGGSSQPHVPVSTASPDTGSVLGDKSASSDSVNKTYTLLRDIQAQNYPVLKSIDAGISGLASGISNVITRLYQGGGLANISAPATQTTFFQSLYSGWSAVLSPFTAFLGWLGNGIFGGEKTYKVTGQGIGTDATSLSAVRAGNNVNSYQYANIETKTDGGWFGSDSYSTSQQRSAIDAKTQKSFNEIFKSMGDTMFGLAKALGGDLTQRVNDYVIPAMNVDLKGLSGEDAAKKMNGVINTMLDNMAGAVFGDILTQYQQLGEGMLETAVRIVSEVTVVKDALASSSITLVDNVIAVSDALVTAAGSLKDFQAQFATYFDKFYSDTEKQTKLQTQLSSQLGSVGESLAASREGYRNQVEAIDITTAAGQAQYSMLLKLSAAADTYYTALDAQTKTYTDAISTAKSNLASAYKSESDAITATISNLSSFIASLKNLKDSLALGNLSTGTPLDKYNEARRQLGNAYNTIQGGAGTTTDSKAAYDAAVGGINTKLTAFLDASKTYNASGSGYTTDYQQVMGMIDSMGLAATAQQTDAERQLEQLTKSVDGLITINTSVLSVRDNILLVNDALTKFTQLETSRTKATEAATAENLVVSNATASSSSISSSLEAIRNTFNQAKLDAADPVAAYKRDNPDVVNNWAMASENIKTHYDMYGQSEGRDWGGSQLLVKGADLQNKLPGTLSDFTNYEIAKLKRSLTDNETGWIKAQMDKNLSPYTIYNNLDSYAGNSVFPAFATGGAHTGGWRIVGENGPELEHTGPSHIFSNAQSKSMFGSGDDKVSQEIVMELRALRAEVTKLRAEQRDNTGALIQSNYDANDQAAEKVVTGTKDTAKQSAWAANSKAVIA